MKRFGVREKVSSMLECGQNPWPAFKPSEINFLCEKSSCGVVNRLWRLLKYLEHRRNVIDLTTNWWVRCWASRQIMRHIFQLNRQAKWRFMKNQGYRIGMWNSPRERKIKEETSQQTSLKQQTAAAAATSEIKQTSMNEIWFPFRS